MRWLEKIHSIKDLNTIGNKKDESSNFSRWAWNSNARIHNKNSKTNGKNWKETYFKTHYHYSKQNIYISHSSSVLYSINQYISGINDNHLSFKILLFSKVSYVKI